MSGEQDPRLAITKGGLGIEERAPFRRWWAALFGIVTLSVMVILPVQSQAALRDGEPCESLAGLVRGTDRSETIRGTDGPDVIWAGGGDGLIYGNGGDDIICGGSGADVIYGGDGNDSIYGGSGNDTIWGGSGNDR